MAVSIGIILMSLTDYLLQAWERGWVINFAVGVTVAEAVYLLANYYLRRRGLAPDEYLLNLLSGLSLMLALRATLLASDPFGPIVYLSLAGGCHVADMVRRTLRTAGR
jgi:integral membrane sensor domain MASE1